MKKRGLEMFTARLFLRNADRDKYGRLMSAMNQDYALGQNPYPDTLREMCQILDRHRWDPEYYEKVKRDQGHAEEKGNEKTTAKAQASFAQQEKKNLVCFACGEPGHVAGADECDNKDLPRDEWWDRKFMAEELNRRRRKVSFSQDASMHPHHYEDQRANNDDDDGSGGFFDDPQPGETRVFQGLQLCHHQQSSAPTPMTITLDSNTQCSSFKSRRLVRNIRASKHPVTVITNAGSTKINQKADLDGIGTVWFQEKGVENVLSFADLKKSYRITYDSDDGDVFIATHRQTNKKLQFMKSARGLYELEVPTRPPTKPTYAAVAARHL